MSAPTSPTPEGRRCPENQKHEVWVPLDGRPATCAQLGCRMYGKPLSQPTPAPVGGERIFFSSARQEGKTEALRRAASPTLAATGGEEPFTDDHVKAIALACEALWNEERWGKPRPSDDWRYVRGNKAHDALNAAERVRSLYAETRRQLAEAEAKLDRATAAYIGAHDIEAAKTREAEERATTAERQLDEVSAALPGVQFMDPPDGGDVSLGEQVHRMAEALATAERRLEEAQKRGDEWKRVAGDAQAFNRREHARAVRAEAEVARLREALEEIRGRLRGGLPHADATDVQRSFELAEAALSSPQQSTGQGGGV